MIKSISSRHWLLMAGGLSTIVAVIALVAPALASAAGRLYWSDARSGQIMVASSSGGSARTLLEAGKEVGGIALDPAQGKIYWATYGEREEFGPELASLGKIEEASIDGKGTPRTLVEGLEGAGGLVIDHLTGKLYWTEQRTGRVRSANLDGTGVSTVFEEPEESERRGGPLGLALDESTGELYWTDEYAGRVMAGSVEGGAQKTLFSGLVDPSDVKVDVARGMIFWASPVEGAVMAGKLDGSGSPELIASEPAGRPFGLALDPTNGRMYWTDIGSDKLMSAFSYGTGTPEQLFAALDEPVYLALLDAPSATSAPAITGSPAIGAALTCANGAWGADNPALGFYQAPASRSYSWLRNGVVVAHASSQSFTPTEGGSYTCAETASNAAGSTTASSAAVNVAAPPPTVKILSPPAGSTFTQGQVVQTSFYCTEGVGGPGLASCDDNTGHASTSGGIGELDTSTVGPHIYVVDAVSKDGQTAIATLFYRVKAKARQAVVAPSVTIASRAAVVSGKAEVRLACAGRSSCIGTLTLERRVKIASKHGKRFRTLVLGRVHYRIAGGKRQLIGVKLTDRAMGLLSQAPYAQLSATATATVQAGSPERRRITLVLKRAGTKHTKKRGGVRPGRG